MAAVLERPQPLPVEPPRPLEPALKPGPPRLHRPLALRLAGAAVHNRRRVRLLVRIDPDYDHLRSPFLRGGHQRRGASGHASVGALPRSYQVTLALLRTDGERQSAPKPTSRRHAG